MSNFFLVRLANPNFSTLKNRIRLMRENSQRINKVKKNRIF